MPLPWPIAPTTSRGWPLLFFDRDSAEPSTRQRDLIADAVERLAADRATIRIDLHAHADRSGPPDHNQRLSRRRAEAVAAELVRSGIRREHIVVRASGEELPMVPTRDGVPEPQNRRVEIVQR